MRKKKIVFVINYFYPDLASTGQLLTELCLNLQKDFEITVIAAQPGYAGEYSNTSKIFAKDKLENIRVIRLRLPNVDKTSKVSRIKYIFTYFILANVALLKENSIDAIYTISQPPVLGGLIGSIGKFFKRSKHIYNIQDFNPEQAMAVSYTNKQFIFNWAKKVDKLSCSYSDCVIVVGNDMKQTLKDRFGSNKTPNHVVINNWTDEDEIKPLSKYETKITHFLKDNELENKFIIMYSGNIGLYYDLENIIKISQHFKDYKDLAFVFIGEGAVKSEMQSYIRENNISNVHFLPYQPKEFIKYSLNAADVHLVVNQKGIKGVSVPSKIYGVMAAGKPILGVLEKDSEAEILISKSNSGHVVEPQDYEGIIEKVEYYYQMDKADLKILGDNGRDYLDKYLKRDISINKYRKTLHEVINS
ncbi:glycosyltransferase family 4 protein [Rossellomorea vietnamensis]|uniref:Glycosyltransferase family 4 protein n=1 Tax=Rossellomorea vietnamensis TaxID=218284 RepID=A0ACD4C6H9_9BACI|nr:glycosyltransferase family 4 protein [Rossellomorea vietnamensis]UXH43197.1 glycosyltransferase family 4 protein [Rossellomorea vietnamensis]